MDFSLMGTMLDPTKSSKLGMEEKRKIVYELAKDPYGMPETLLSWSRQEILQLLCAEMGKERKYTGLTKLKIIENLLKIVSEKISRESGGGISEQPLPDSCDNRTPKSQRKPDHLSPFLTPESSASGSNGSSIIRTVTQCKNSACKAGLSPEDAFCKRCSCCICRKFDDNKDPSLWLTCGPEPPFEGESCNMSCHLECALSHERSGLSKRGQVSQLDGSFYCVSCGKMNDLLNCWRKQLVFARDTRRVDILCYRVFLSQKLLNGSNKYQKLSEIVDEAVSKLQAEVGPLTDMTVKMGRGIVNRMSTGHEVQRLCASAVELLDSILSEATVVVSLTRPADQDSRTSAPSIVRFEDVCDTSVTAILGPANQVSEVNVRYTLWHRKAVEEKEPPEPTCTLSPPGTRVVVRGLVPSTEYVFKVVCFDSFQEPSTYEARLSTVAPSAEIIPNPGATLERSQSPVTNCSTLSNPSSVEDETNNITSGLNENNRTDNYYDCMKPANTMNGPSSCIGGVGQDENSVHALDVKDIPNNAASLDQSGTPNLENKHSQECLVGEANELNKAIIPFPPPETGLPITPSRVEILETIRKIGRPKSSKKDTGNAEDQPQPRSSSKKRDRESQEEDTCEANEDLEFYVKVIRRLECDGHIEKSFRQKFLTWYSLRATPQETHVVQVFVNTLRDDPAALAEQLIDAFEEVASNKRSEPLTKPGFCMKLWH